MRKQRLTAQMKEEKAPERNEMEWREKMGMLNELRGETSDLSEDGNGAAVRVKKDVEPTKRTRRK